MAPLETRPIPEQTSVVQLISGGPKMTTSGERNEMNHVRCYWFSKDHTLHDAYFHVHSLKIASDEDD